MQFSLLNINTRKITRVVADADWEGEEDDRIEAAADNRNPDVGDNDDSDNEGGGGGDDDDDREDGMQQD